MTCLSVKACNRAVFKFISITPVASRQAGRTVAADALCRAANVLTAYTPRNFSFPVAGELD